MAGIRVAGIWVALGGGMARALLAAAPEPVLRELLLARDGLGKTPLHAHSQQVPYRPLWRTPGMYRIPG